MLFAKGWQHLTRRKDLAQMIGIRHSWTWRVPGPKGTPRSDSEIEWGSAKTNGCHIHLLEANPVGLYHALITDRQGGREEILMK
jgi:hypothetical protein